MFCSQSWPPYLISTINRFAFLKTVINEASLVRRVVSFNSGTEIMEENREACRS